MPINSPIQSPHPADIEFGFKKLNRRQQNLLDLLSTPGKHAHIKKKSISMLDLSTLSAYTGDEFSMFTNGSKRWVIRGIANTVPISIADSERIRESGYRWSGHTHVGRGRVILTPSGLDGDIDTLRFLEQKRSVIYNSVGDFYVFGQEG